MLSSVKNRLKILKFNLWNQIDISVMKELDEYQTERKITNDG